MSPEYRMASPGTLIRPTSVAATSCQAVCPESSHGGMGNRSRYTARFNGVLLSTVGKSRYPCPACATPSLEAGAAPSYGATEWKRPHPGRLFDTRLTGSSLSCQYTDERRGRGLDCSRVADAGAPTRHAERVVRARSPRQDRRAAGPVRARSGDGGGDLAVDAVRTAGDADLRERG